MLKPVIAAACLCAATVAEAESSRLSEREINALVAGATVEIDTPLGTKLPIRYAADGQLSGQARDLASYLGSATDTGRWWVASDKLCHKWNRWFDSEPQCMQLRKDGRTLHWRNQDGNSGTAVIAVPAPIKAAAVLPRAQVETKPPAAAPVPLPAPDRLTPANSFITAAQPVQAPAEASEPLQAAEPSVEVLAAEVPRPQAARSPKAQQEPTPPIETEPAYMVANVARDDVLNVRSGPSTEFEVVAELRPGSRGISITGACRSEWCPVQHESTTGWVNRMFLANEEPVSASRRTASIEDLLAADAGPATSRDSPEAPRACLTPAARALIERIEEKFGPVKLVSTCRPGATIAGSGRPSRHASGNAVDFDADRRKADIVEWLIDNHHDGGTMTYAGMDHIHVDIGPHFVSIAGGRHWASWRDRTREFPGRMARTGGND
jgi:Bacterial SH3 domain/Peptidase M15